MFKAGKKGKFHLSKKVSIAVLIIIVLIFALVLGIDIPQKENNVQDVYSLSEDQRVGHDSD